MIDLLTCAALFLLLSCSQSRAAEQEWVLPPIVAEGTPADALKYDPMTSAVQGSTQIDAGSGSAERSVQNQIPLAVRTNGRPGNVSTFLGVGKNAEETDVNALGIPLNSPQGGGFDLSSFPQFLWTSFSYQKGPSLGAFDPRGIAGSLTLVPWTQQALTSDLSEVRGTAFHSTAHFQQFSAALKSKNDLAVLVGASTGDLQGPAGSVSGRWGSGALSGKYHLLATDQQTAHLISDRSGANTGKQRTVRFIPVLQADLKLEELVVKTSFFFDSTYLRYDDSPNNDFRRTHATQEGVESALLMREWKFGLSARRLDYHTLDFSVPTEHIISSQITRSFDLAHIFIEPTLQGTIVSRFGLYPTGSLGARKEFGSGDFNQALFTRASYSKRFPSLVDRYYEIPGFVLPNPTLQPETAYTFNAGYEFTAKNWATSVEGYSQFREDSRYLSHPIGSPYRVINAGNAHVHSLSHNLSLSPKASFTLSNRLSLTESYINIFNGPFTFMPGLTDIASLDIHEPSLQRRWSSFLAIRSSNHYFVSENTEAGGYYYIDAGAKVFVLNGIYGSVTIENLTNREIDLRGDVPTLGRIYTVSLLGTF